MSPTSTQPDPNDDRPAPTPYIPSHETVLSREAFVVYSALSVLLPSLTLACNEEAGRRVARSEPSYAAYWQALVLKLKELHSLGEFVMARDSWAARSQAPVEVLMSAQRFLDILHLLQTDMPKVIDAQVAHYRTAPEQKRQWEAVRKRFQRFNETASLVVHEACARRDAAQTR